jgi:hypothetical protein
VALAEPWQLIIDDMITDTAPPTTLIRRSFSVVGLPPFRYFLPELHYTRRIRNIV